MGTRQLHSRRTIDVSALCLGVMFLGVREAQDSSFAILDRYFEAGGRFFDTANNYGAWTEDTLGTRTGDSERLLGRWIAARGVADEVVVATKCGAGKADEDRPLSGEPPTNYEGLAPEVVRTQLAASLERLGLDRVGVYYGHVDDRTLDVAEIADTFAGLVEEGLVTVPGLSNTATWRLAEARAHSRADGRAEFGAWQQKHSLYWPAAGAEEHRRHPRGSGLRRRSPGADDHFVLTAAAGPARPALDAAAGAVRPPGQRAAAADGAPDRARPWRHRQPGRAGLAPGRAAQRDRLPRGQRRPPLAELPARRATMIPVIGARTVAQLEEALGALEVELTDG